MFHHRGRGKRLFRYLIANKDKFTELQIASRFFILNRISFSGLVESGGYSKESFDLRFTESSIERVKKASEVLQGVTITNLDYSKLLFDEGKNIFIFLDPPYLSKTKAKLYGKKGEFHVGFEHKVLRENVEKCSHKWLITYDKCADIDEMYKFVEEIGWSKKEWTLQYGTNVNSDKAKIGNELFILNYKIKKND